MNDITRHYTNGEVTIVWKPALCIHSKICWQAATGLPQVFHPATRPWITPQGVSTERVIEQVRKCPSGALSFFLNGDEVKEEEALASEIIAEVMPAGPLLVYGNITVKHIDGSETRKSKVTAFCRCGSSGNKPYCDGTHKKIGFKG
jgi:uncharacterized Fe-S cluster protein YjdI